MKRILTIASLLASIVFVEGCYYDKEEIVYPSNPNNPAGCDTATMTYTAHILPIITNNCYSCHTASGSAGIPLDSYTDVAKYAGNGKLIHRITSTDPSIMMPKGGPRLSDCNISKIQAWVNAGAPQ